MLHAAGLASKDKMNNKYLIIAIMTGLFSFITSCFSGKQGDSVTMSQLMNDDQPDGERIILAKMSESEIQTAVKDYMKLCADNDDHIESPVITESAEGFVVRLPNSTTYDRFCFWVNYIIYSNKNKRYNDSVIGWYEVPAAPRGVWEPFAGQKLMFFIPASDEEFDNVYFTTKDNTCYKQVFWGKARLKKQKTVLKEYISRD